MMRQRHVERCRCGESMTRVLAHWICRKCGTVRVLAGRLPW